MTERSNVDEWPVLDSVVEYETGWYTGGYDLVEQPDGSSKKYYWAELRPTVVIVPIVEDEIVFVEQYRPTIRKMQLELPAGIVEPGESASEAAARELAEETGFAAGGLAILQSMWIATGVLRHRRTVVFAEGLTPVMTNRDENEFLTVTTRPVEEAIDNVRQQPANAMSMTGLLLAKEEGLLPVSS